MRICYEVFSLQLCLAWLFYVQKHYGAQYLNDFKKFIFKLHFVN